MNDLLCEGQEIIIIGRSGYGGYVREPSRFDHDFVEQCLEFLPKFISRLGKDLRYSVVHLYLIISETLS